MAKRKINKDEAKNQPLADNVHIKGAGSVQDEVITNTLTDNFMPYAMSIILSRAIPQIDGFKPSHRKLLYTMYNMGLLQSGTIKSANIVGRTMQLNPHGDAAIYETMIRLSRGNETLLHPYVESKGNFGKAYSKNMVYAASRYTEAKLAPICHELFDDIKSDTVDFVDNYDNTMKEPTLLPVTFPSILCNVTTGIAAGMASSIASFNLKEICDTTIALMKNPDHEVSDTLLAPDFVGGGYILYDKEEFDKIYRTGRGSVKVRAKYSYDKKYNCIDITQIPPTATSEAIIDKIVELVKTNKIKEISDVRDETDLSGLKITIDLKRGVEPDKFMAKLYKSTPLQDSFSCNFNVLIKGRPMVLGVRDILLEWVDFRLECIRRRVTFNLNKKKNQLHLLKGLSKILLDIDKAIKIVRETESESEVVPNLMIGFGIDEIQAEYVAEIKLRHLNREYILNRTKEIESLKKSIAENEEVLESQKKIRKIIISELKDVIKKYGQPRKTLIYYAENEENSDVYEEEVPDYPVNYFLSKEGYFKKITPQSLRMSKEMKWKEDDETVFHIEKSNRTSLLFFTDKGQVYKSSGSAFADTKASAIGEYLPAKLGFDKDENVKGIIVTDDYSEKVVFVYANGKAAKIPVSAYETKTNRKKLSHAYYEKSELLGIFKLSNDEHRNICIKTSNNKIMIFSTDLLSDVAKRDSVGMQVISVRKGYEITDVHEATDEEILTYPRAVSKKIPSTGYQLKENPQDGQMHF